MQIPRSFKRKQIQVENFLWPHQELHHWGHQAFITLCHHLQLPQPRLKETLFGQGPSPTRSPVSAPVQLNHLIIDRRSSWALVSHTREGALAHTHSLTEHPHSLSRLKPWPTEDSSTPFFHYHLFNFIQCWVSALKSRGRRFWGFRLHYGDELGVCIQL